MQLAYIHQCTYLLGFSFQSRSSFVNNSCCAHDLVYVYSQLLLTEMPFAVGQSYYRPIQLLHRELNYILIHCPASISRLLLTLTTS